MRVSFIASIIFGAIVVMPMLSTGAVAQIQCGDDSTRCQGGFNNPGRFFNDIGDGNLNGIRQCDVCDAIALRQCANLGPTLPPGLSPVTGADAAVLVAEYNNLVFSTVFDRGTLRDQCRNFPATQATLDNILPFASPQ